MARPIDPQEVAKLLSYNHETGALVWLSGRRKGLEAGCAKHRGYRRVCMPWGLVMAHRLAWALFHGNDPGDAQIDHIDGNRLNNSIGNLRLATGSENRRNGRIKTGHKIGLKGVWRHRDRYAAQFKPQNGKRVFLGIFETAEQAHAAYVEAARKHSDFWCDGRR